MNIRTLMKFIKLICYNIYMTLMTFSRSWIQRSRSRAIVSENALFRRRYVPIDDSPSKTMQFALGFPESVKGCGNRKRLETTEITNDI